MSNNGYDFDLKVLHLLNDNEIDIRGLTELLERCQQNLTAIRQNLKEPESVDPAAIDGLSNFFDLLERVQINYPNEVIRFIPETIAPEEKFELMVQNAEKFVWLLELEKRKK